MGAASGVGICPRGPGSADADLRALLGKPPSRWLAQDVAVWEGRLAEACSAFLRLEAAAFGTGSYHRNAVRLAVTHVDGRERVEVLALEETPEQATFLRTILALIEENGVDPALVVAKLAESLIAPDLAEAAPAQVEETGT